ncbi:hypothetical protein EVAR_74080_1 [Eumeta japonica]|uniref:Uncharacterized protein n=1 Tax=Eumeta variegata TaxID=151549 RepID=A0A4C1T9A2_EUMVA|nr:hypothetical protein EVAR_74080_1 [Eumeta japonica]
MISAGAGRRSPQVAQRRQKEISRRKFQTRRATLSHGQQRDRRARRGVRREVLERPRCLTINLRRFRDAAASGAANEEMKK